MKTNLKDKKILLGVTGSIAAYKAIELTRLLVAEGAIVQVVLTASAAHFVTPLSLQAVSGRAVRTQTFDLDAEAAMSHIELARWADLILIAPASANLMAELAHGFAQDLLTTLCLASEAPIYLAPAMNRIMWENQATLANLTILKNRGILFLGPGVGLQACGESGFGRMLEPIQILQELQFGLENEFFLKGSRIVVTAGPTREALDPVRYLSNQSSGKMGYALAEMAARAGAEVILVSGPVSLPTPLGVTLCSVETAVQMYDKVMQLVGEGCSVFIGAAAVADYRPQIQATQKMKKLEPEMTLHLIRNPDILMSVAALPAVKRPLTVGFAAETQDCVAQGRVKLKNKNLDLIAVNDVSQSDIGFYSDLNALTILFRDGREQVIEKASKKSVAYALLKMIGSVLG